MSAYVLYRCRRCGVVFKDECQSVHPDRVRDAVIEAMEKKKSYSIVGFPVYLVTIHKCDKTGYGLADLQGGNDSA